MHIYRDKRWIYTHGLSLSSDLDIIFMSCLLIEDGILLIIASHKEWQGYILPLNLLDKTKLVNIPMIEGFYKDFGNQKMSAMMLGASGMCVYGLGR